ncbi:MAG: hypothetical protein JSV49_12085 [Thermoplasmata archaeon]|nr:MAG: hypothetical protein JSV49_12085 [Thermoplasmata archaeon]
MAKQKKETAGRRQTSKVAMSKLKKSQNIVIMFMILVMIVGLCLMVFAHFYDSLDYNSGQTTDPGQAIKIEGFFSKTPVEIDIQTTAQEPPKYYIISNENFVQISPDKTVPNEYTDPKAVQQIEQAATEKQYDQKDFYYEGELERGDWYILVVTNTTEGKVNFNMVYDISAYGYRPLVLWVIFPIILLLEILFFAYSLVINSRLKKVQEKISTQRLLKAQMNMVRNFILQSSGTQQSFGFSASPYRTDSGESVPRDGVPLAVGSKEMEIVECYGCKELITINSPERPLIVACPNCGLKSQVTEEDEEEEEAKAAKAKEPSKLPPAEAEVRALPPGSPPPEEQAPPTPSPAPATPVPNPNPESGEMQ